MKGAGISLAGLVNNPQASNPLETETQLLETLAIYYGWPSSVNGAKSLDAAIKYFSYFENLILGAGLELNTHQEHVVTTDIIASLPNTKVFGYINLGYFETEFGNYVYSDRGLTRRIDSWAKMGVYGVFFDKSSLTYGVDKGRLEYAINECRIRDLKVFINSDNPQWIIDTSIIDEYDSASVLIEPFLFSEGKEVPSINPYGGWSEVLGVRVFGVSTYDPNMMPNAINKLVIDTRDAAMKASLTGFAVSDPLYSAYDVHTDHLLITKWIHP